MTGSLRPKEDDVLKFLPRMHSYPVYFISILFVHDTVKNGRLNAYRMIRYTDKFTYLLQFQLIRFFFLFCFIVRRKRRSYKLLMHAES